MFLLSYTLIYRWNPTKFVHRNYERIVDKKSRGYWNDLASQREFMDKLSKSLGITNMEGWYTVTRSMLIQHGASGLLQKYKDSPSKLITSVYPEYQRIQIFK